MIHDIIQSKKTGKSPYGGAAYGGHKRHVGHGAYGGGLKRGQGIAELFNMGKNLLTSPYRIMKGIFTGSAFKKPAPKPVQEYYE